jgi:hypothetical protein
LAGAVRHLLARLRSPIRRDLEGTRREPPDLYFHALTHGWFRRQQWPFDYNILVWRSLSVPMLRVYIPDSARGRRVLERVERFEDRFPELCGRWGQYPLIAIHKPAETKRIGLES